ncbi:MAG: sensor histidine kinase, partial [Pyrinomonadaceae bacterium]
MRLFLDQLIRTLEVEQTSEPMESRKVSGPAGGGDRGLSEIGKTAASHGRELLIHGYTIEQVVHDYGDLCQAATDLATELNEPISSDEFRTLNRCLDNGIADAVTEFTSQRDANVAGRHAENVTQRLGEFAHEARNSVHTAMLALEVIKTGKVGITGATVGVLERSLARLTNLIDRSLAQVRVEAGLAVQTQLYPLNKFIAEVRLSAMLDAEARDCTLNVSFVDADLAVDVDRDLLFSALGNLLQNAFKFTHANTVVTLDC